MNQLLLFQLLGKEVPIVSSQSLFNNQLVVAWQLVVENTTDHQPEEQCHLFVQHNNNQPTVEILYVQLGKQQHQWKIFWLQFQLQTVVLFTEKTFWNQPPFDGLYSSDYDINFCSKTKQLINELTENRQAFRPLIEQLNDVEISVQLLRKAVEHLIVPFEICPVPACRFLAHDSEREKIIAAIELVTATIDQPLTIKELSRKVAMNECYLKKGFKTVTGKTINEYQQHLRISKAKELLQQQGQTVSDVAISLGYSSISHFSTAFKKATGMKPCELLA